MGSPEKNLAVEAVHRAVLHPEDFPDRASAGDCLVGALAAGADYETAVKLALEIHMNPGLNSRIPKTGGLLVGAQVYIEELE